MCSSSRHAHACPDAQPTRYRPTDQVVLRVHVAGRGPQQLQQRLQPGAVQRARLGSVELDEQVLEGGGGWVKEGVRKGAKVEDEQVLLDKQVLRVRSWVGWGGGGAWDRHAQSFASPTQICLFGGSPHFLYFCRFAH
jgi:hypothetical protein